MIRMRIVPDTSVIVDGRITRIVQEEDYKGCEVIVPEAVVSELENQANKGRDSGYNGLEELKNLQNAPPLCRQRGCSIWATLGVNNLAITSNVPIRFSHW